MTTSSTSTTSTTTAEAEVRGVLEEYTQAYVRRDPDAILASFADGAARFGLAPPLQQAPGTMVGDVAGLAAWLSGFDGPVRFEHRDLVVTTGGDVALAHALTRLTATPAGAPEPFSFWFRSTFGLRRLDGRWRLVHEHQSTPFHMDGSFRAAVDLEP